MTIATEPYPLAELADDAEEAVSCWDKEDLEGAHFWAEWIAVRLREMVNADEAQV